MELGRSAVLGEKVEDRLLLSVELILHLQMGTQCIMIT